MNRERRNLKFDRLADVVADAESLHARGYEKLGQWDLAQVCGHLAEWLRYPVEGFPSAPFPVSVILWTMRKTVGKRMLKNILDAGFKPGGPTIKESVPQIGGDENDAVERLRQAVARFENHTGELIPSPVFGTLARDQARRLQLAHCAHHLGFLIPIS